MKTYAIKLTTGENLAYATLAEVEEIMSIVQQERIDRASMGYTQKLIKLQHMEGNTVCYVFADFIMGYVIIGGDSLASIMSSSENKSLQEMKAEAAELNLYSEKRTP